MIFKFFTQIQSIAVSLNIYNQYLNNTTITLNNCKTLQYKIITNFAYKKENVTLKYENKVLIVKKITKTIFCVLVLAVNS